MFRQDGSCPALLVDRMSNVAYGALTLHARLSSLFRYHNTRPLASSAFARHYSRSLVDVLSSGYLDVSVPQVRLHDLCVRS